MIRAHHLNVSIGARHLVIDGSVDVRHGQKVALTGRNGTGKSTVICVLTGTADPAVAHSGEIVVTGSVGHLPQNPTPEGLGLDSIALTHVLSARGLDRIDAAMAVQRQLIESSGGAEGVQEFVDLESEFGAAGGYTAEGDIARLAEGVGLAEDVLLQDLTELSGGQRRRLELVRVLYGNAEVMILDEPTNHLDLAGKRWLMKELTAYQGCLLIVSHDIKLLDSAISSVIDLRSSKLTAYKGTYSSYRTQLAEEIERRGKSAMMEQKEIKRLSTQADHMRGRSGRLARAAHSIDQRVDRLKATQTETMAAESKQTFKLPKPPRENVVPLEVHDIGVQYGENTVLKKVSFTLHKGDRMVIIGRNGAGKSSLLRCIMQMQEPTNGHVKIGTLTHLGFFAQEHEDVDHDIPAIDNLLDTKVLTDPDRRRLLGGFGLSGEKATQITGKLSGGERAKLVLAKIAANEPNMLILDEPTNNLDIPSIAGLTALLRTWQGSMVLVSHDRNFVSGLKPTHALHLPSEKYGYWDEDMLDEVEDK
ncbi:MAG: ABC-F family ATP-binding cassette domain-containing protein [Acidimicrobiia bacterium]